MHFVEHLLISPLSAERPHLPQLFQTSVMEQPHMIIYPEKKINRFLENCIFSPFDSIYSILPSSAQSHLPATANTFLYLPRVGARDRSHVASKAVSEDTMPTWLTWEQYQ